MHNIEGEAMRIIDVDSHLMEPFDWLDEHFPDLAAALPPVDFAARFQSRVRDDMMDAVPRRRARRRDE